MRPPAGLRARAPAAAREDRLVSSMGWGVAFVLGQLGSQPWDSAAMDAVPPFSPDAEPVNILCMDGGGIRGRNQVVIVEELEAALGWPVAEQFDLVAGTSIGGCGALFVAKYGARATAMARTAMRELQLQCFAQPSRRQLLSQGHLCRDARREFMIELCGPDEDLALPPSHSPRAFALSSRLVGSSYNPTALLEPFLFRTYEPPPDSSALPGTSRAELWRAVAATSAAPFMFPRATLGAMRLTDGGLVANDPTLVAIQEAAALWPDRPLGLVVSLGTGEEDDGSEDGLSSAREAQRSARIAAAVRARGARA